MPQVCKSVRCCGHLHETARSDVRCTTFMHPSPSVHDDRSSGCPASPPCSCPITDSLMLRCQQHLSKLVAAAPRDGELTLPMFTRILPGPDQPAVQPCCRRCFRFQIWFCAEPFGSLCSSSDDELEQCESPAVHVCRQPDPLLTDDLMEDLDAGFWQAQEDLLSQEELLSALGGGLSEGFDPCFMAKHAVHAQKRLKPTHARRPSSPPLPPASTSSAAA